MGLIHTCTQLSHPWAHPGPEQGATLAGLHKGSRMCCSGPVAKSKERKLPFQGWEGRRVTQAHRERGVWQPGPGEPWCDCRQVTYLAWGAPFPHRQRKGSEARLTKAPFHKWDSVVFMTAGYF